MRYGRGKYGGFKYGITDNPNLGWRFLINWDDEFWTPEVDRVTDLVITRGRDNLISRDKIEEMKAGEVVLTLDNHDGRYDPFNASSPLYNLIGPGKRLQISVKNGDTGGDWIVFTGTISEITPFGRWNKTQIRAVDDLNLLNNKIVNYGLVEGCRVDEAIRNVLLTAGSADSDLSLDMSSDFIHFWWAAKQSAKDTIDELSQAHMDEWAVTADGKIRYKAHNEQDAVKLTLNSNDLLKDISFLMPWDVQRNLVEYTIYPVETDSVIQIIWENKSAIFIQAGEMIEIDADFSVEGQDCIAKEYVFGGVNLIATTGVDGTGANVALNISWQYYGSYAHIIITNVDSVDGYIQPHKEDSGNGYAIGTAYLVYNKSSVRKQVGSSQQSQKSLIIDSKYMQDRNLANGLATYYVNWLYNTKHYPTVILECRNDIQFSIDLLDKVRVKLDVLGLDAEFRVGKITTSWLSENGSLSRTVLKLEPVKAFGDYWELDTDALNTTTIIGV